VAKRTCSIEGCERPSHCRGWCTLHYHRWVTTGTTELRPKPAPVECRTEGCPALVPARSQQGLCPACYQRWRRRRTDGLRCTLEGCDRPLYGRGWCAVHYDRWRSNGDPLVVQRIRDDDDRRFWSYVDRRGDDECWPWTGAITHEGYGVLQFGGEQVKAHRHAYEKMVGPVPDELTLDHVCHSSDPSCFLSKRCPHRRCVNPAHLEPVTNEENTRRGRRLAKTHCPRGHPYDVVAGVKKCRICHRDRERERRAKAKAA
jgi:hypothetical protein